ncbi:hypothetical protein NIES3804_08140 [Microcystis aeruginosa NIES-3804]|uniref:Uncharacterized protein n=1 Tax=Microcystis aeruginosa NIES-3804 TaxID=2517783 RepID=A0A6H9GNR4_MICAE|nr:hypothetical protein NIES3804_08140 [Microcystis aeruginosa NIES-3804]
MISCFEPGDNFALFLSLPENGFLKETRFLWHGLGNQVLSFGKFYPKAYPPPILSSIAVLSDYIGFYRCFSSIILG